MNIRFRYVLLVATNAFRKTLVELLATVKGHAHLRCVVVVNGSDHARLADQYSAAIADPQVEIIQFEPAGKSGALNHYIRSVSDPDTFIIFVDDDIVMPRENVDRYIAAVEAHGKGHYYGGGVDVSRLQQVDPRHMSLYPASIRGVSEKEHRNKKIFLGFNWGAFASDIADANYFNPNFGPGSITGAVGQESQMMLKMLARGVKAIAIPNCRVIHQAPTRYHERQWLFNRRFNEGISRGLLYKKKFLRSLARKVGTIITGPGLKRRANFHFVMGMLYSLKYIFRKFD
jgi:glycosyltransferase involved in cell wall biosynthesis